MTKTIFTSRLYSNMEDAQLASDAVAGIIESIGCSQQESNRFQAAFLKILQQIMVQGFETSSEGDVDVRVEVDNNDLLITIQYAGERFQFSGSSSSGTPILSNQILPASLLEQTFTGLTLDRVEWDYSDGYNHLQIRKRIQPVKVQTAVTV